MKFKQWLPLAVFFYCYKMVNTWNNRLVGDSHLPKEKRIAYTAYPFKMEDKPLLPAGLLGPVVIEVAK